MPKTVYTIQLNSKAFEANLARVDRKVTAFEAKLRGMTLGGAGLGGMAGSGGGRGRVGRATGKGLHGASFFGINPSTIAVAGVVAGIGAITSKLVKMSVVAENARFSMRKIFGEKSGDALLKDIQAFAGTTPLRFGDVLNQSIKLAGVGVSKENIIPMQSMLGNFTSVLGADPALMTKAFTDVIAKGKLEGQEVRQFANQNLMVKKMVADFRGTTTAEVEGTLVTSKELVQVMLHAQREGTRFHNVMEEKSKTIEGRWSNIGDAVDRVFMRAGEASLSGLGSLMGTLERAVLTLQGIKLEELSENLFLIGEQMIGILNIGSGSTAKQSPLIILLDGISLALNSIAGGFSLVKLMGTGAWAGLTKNGLMASQALSQFSVDALTIAGAQANILDGFGFARKMEGLPKSNVKDVNLDDPILGGAGGAGGAGKRGGSSVSGIRGGRAVTINIENVIREQNINGTTSLGETAQEIKHEVSKALSLAFSDVTTVSNIG